MKEDASGRRFPDQHDNKNPLKNQGVVFLWWAVGDSNSEPSDEESLALPIELTAQRLKLYEYTGGPKVCQEAPRRRNMASRVGPEALPGKNRPQRRARRRTSPAPVHQGRSRPRSAPRGCRRPCMGRAGSSGAVARGLPPIGLTPPTHLTGAALRRPGNPLTFSGVMT